jgi:hypothetical protein
MERKIGEIFHDSWKGWTVVQEADGICEKCCYNAGDTECLSQICGRKNRNDHKSVNFVNIPRIDLTKVTPEEDQYFIYGNTIHKAVLYCNSKDPFNCGVIDENGRMCHYYGKYESQLVYDFIRRISDTDAYLKIDIETSDSPIYIKVNTAEEELNDKIEASKYMLKLKLDWDEEGGLPITYNAFDSMRSFLINYFKQVLKEYRKTIVLPSISPSSEGSIDLEWNQDKYSILINIDKTGNKATYYADDTKAEQKQEGQFDPNHFLLNLLPIAINYGK